MNRFDVGDYVHPTVGGEKYQVTGCTVTPIGWCYELVREDATGRETIVLQEAMLLPA